MFKHKLHLYVSQASLEANGNVVKDITLSLGISYSICLASLGKDLEMAGEVVVDALPYIDQGYDEPGVREAVGKEFNFHAG